MSANTKKTPGRLSLETKTLIASLSVESFCYRNRSHVNVVTCATDPSISVFVYIDGKAEKSWIVFLTDHNAAEQLQVILSEVRSFKRIGTFNLPTLLAS